MRAWRAAVPFILLTASAAIGQPTIGPQIRIDQGGNALANETTASASEFDSSRIVTGWNDYRVTGKIRAAFGLSVNSGATWTDFLLRPPLANQANVEGDPMTAYDDRTGTLWAGAISFAANGGLFVARLDPGETEFTPAVMADVGFVDKCWMAAGPLPGQPDSTRLYVTYDRGIIWSDDMGDTWTAPETLGSGIGFLPRIGPTGTLYVAYWNYGTGVMLKRSLDGGETFTTLQIATRLDVWGTEENTRVPGIFRVPSLVYLAVDPTNGALYALYFDTTNIINGNANLDLYFTGSVDGGDTWSTPQIINNDSGDPLGDQFFPWIEVDGQGRVHIVSMDGRHANQQDNDPSGLFDVYYTYHLPGAPNFVEVRLTPQSWFSSGASFIGDYVGMACAGDRVYPVYLQMDDGDQNIYTHVINYSACPSDCDGSDDGIVGIDDFLAVLSQWGQIGASCDTGAGTPGVGVDEFLDVIAHWGACQ